MPFRHISKDIKDRALWLIENGYARDDVAEILGVSIASIYRWKNNDEHYGSVIPPPLAPRGRPRILNPDMTHDLYTLIEEAPYLYLDEIQEWLIVAHNIGISRSAVDVYLRDLGISYKLLHKAAKERDEERREEFRQHAQQNWVARQLVFVDETSKDERTIYRHYGRSIKGTQAHLSAPFVRGQRYSIVAALGVDGYVNQRVVEGSIDGVEFLMFIQEDVVSW
jgi:transposase